MIKAAITAPELAPPAGPFSQAIEVGGFLYFSGRSAKTRLLARWSRGALGPRQSASFGIFRRFSRRRARVSITLRASECISRT